LNHAQSVLLDTTVVMVLLSLSHALRVLTMTCQGRQVVWNVQKVRPVPKDQPSQKSAPLVSIPMMAQSV
jgi:hypothetical protein